jgi:hypothetical protein
MDKVYNEIFKDCTERPTHAFLQRQNENLKILCEASAQHQQALVRKRLPDESSPPQYLYKAGDLVLFDAGPKPTKMASRHKGPFEVIRQRSNDAQVQDVSTGVVTEYSVGDRSPFFGSKIVAAQLITSGLAKCYLCHGISIYSLVYGQIFCSQRLSR